MVSPFGNSPRFGQNGVPFQQFAGIAQGGDPFFNQLIGQSMGAGFGANPFTYAAPPGPASIVTGYVNNDMFRGGWQSFLPQPTLPPGTVAAGSNWPMYFGPFQPVQ